MVSSGEFYSSVLIPPIQNNQKKPVHTLALRSAVSVQQKRGCFSAGTVYSSALFLMVPEQSEETNQPQRGMVWWCWNRLFCCSVLRGSEQSEQTGCWVVPFRDVISTHRTDGVSFARISLLGWVWSSGGTFHYPPRLLALYGNDSGVIRAVVCSCGAGISLSHFALGSFDGWYPDG